LLMADGDTASEARDKLGNSAENIGLGDNESGNGLLDAEAAVGGSGGDGSNGIGEIGSVTTNQSDSSEWHRISLGGSYTDPVVVMKPLSYDGGHPAHARLRNVTGDSFECKIEEWKYLDGSHTSETVHYLVIEAGTHELSDGTRIEAGTTRTDNHYTSVGFSHSFTSAPVVFSQSQTFNGNHPVITRNEDVSTDGFSTKIQEEEAEGWHTDESVGYVAVESNAGSNDGSPYVVGRVANTVTNEWHTISFDQSYSDPQLVVDSQTVDGWQPAGIRYRNLTGDSVEVCIEEEQSEDDETYHASEAVGYAVFEGSGSVSGS